MKNMTILSGFLLLLASAARAAGPDGKLGVGFRAGGAVPFGTPIVSDAGNAGPWGGLRLQYVETPSWSWVLDFDHLRMEGDSNIHANAFNFGGRYTFEKIGMRPSVFMGLGPTNLQNIPSSDAESMSLGTKVAGSLDFPLGDRWVFSPEIAYHFVSQIDDGEHDVHAATFGVGLTYFFTPSARSPRKKMEARATPAEYDPAPVPEIEPLTPEMEAPPSFEDAEVPGDEDEDGVADDADRCPGTPPGAQVNIKGCGIITRGESVSMKIEVNFASDKDAIRNRYRDEIRKVAELLENHPGSTALIEGHTDSVGERSHNIDLSQRRADAVREFLIAEFGVDSARLRSKGFGPDRPVADNRTRAGRKANRRVVATISGEE